MLKNKTIILLFIFITLFGLVGCNENGKEINIKNEKIEIKINKNNGEGIKTKSIGGEVSNDGIVTKGYSESEIEF